MNRGGVQWIQDDVMLRHGDYLQVSIPHGVVPLRHFQKHRFLLAVLLVEQNLLYLALLHLGGILFRQGILSISSLLLSLGIFLQLSYGNTVAVTWRWSDGVRGCSLPRDYHAFCQRHRRLRPVCHQDDE